MDLIPNRLVDDVWTSSSVNGGPPAVWLAESRGRGLLPSEPAPLSGPSALWRRGGPLSERRRFGLGRGRRAVIMMTSIKYKSRIPVKTGEIPAFDFNPSVR